MKRANISHVWVYWISVEEMRATAETLPLATELWFNTNGAKFRPFQFLIVTGLAVCCLRLEH